jgi:ATP-dependent DNA helicase PIF1
MEEINNNLENNGKRWTDENIKYLFDEIKLNNSIENIANQLKRTNSSVQAKLYLIANQLVNIYGLDIDLISNLIKIDKNKLIEYFDNNKNKSEIKVITSKDIISETNNDLKAIDNQNLIIELNSDQQKAVDEFINKKNIFLTGPAGTGKSVTLRKIIEYCNLNKILYGVTATTGSAALLIGGKTINSYLGIGLIDKSPNEMFNYVRYKYHHIMKKIRELKLLIIDEISLMDDELFNFISEYLKLCNKNSLPFGGIQVILTGDFCQLESINGNFCFNTKAWKELKLEIIFLHKMIRQNEDKTFQKMLRELRYGICSDKTFNRLLLCKDTNFNDIKPTILFSKNIDVDKINDSEYKSLIDKKNGICNETIYPMIFPDLKKDHDKIKNWIKTLDIPSSVKLCIDAQIIVTANINQEKGVVNGTRGRITTLLPDRIIIEKVDKSLVIINYHKCIFNEDKNIYFSYMPIKLGYALTIHKAQGMTLDAIEIDIGKNIFASGQAYTAISRARNLNSIKIKDISQDSFIIRSEVLEFYSKIDNKIIFNT